VRAARLPDEQPIMAVREIVTNCAIVTIGEDGPPFGKKRKSFPKFDCYRL
jgi:hypothetical protein